MTSLKTRIDDQLDKYNAVNIRLKELEVESKKPVTTVEEQDRQEVVVVDMEEYVAIKEKILLLLELLRDQLIEQNPEYGV